MRHIRSIFVRTPGEPWPPRWILFLGVIAVLGSSLWSVNLQAQSDARAARSETVATQQGEDRQQLARLITEICDGGGEFKVNNRNVCIEAEEQANKPVPVPDSNTNSPLTPKDGKDGRDGFDGKDGPPGAKGDKGDKGDDGLAGLSVRGDNGTNGLDGLSIKGETGDTGATGATGETGATGATGSPGADGQPGPAPSKLTFKDGTTCTPTAPGSTEYNCDGPPPAKAPLIAP